MADVAATRRKYGRQKGKETWTFGKQGRAGAGPKPLMAPKKGQSNGLRASGNQKREAKGLARADRPEVARGRQAKRGTRGQPSAPRSLTRPDPGRRAEKGGGRGGGEGEGGRAEGRGARFVVRERTLEPTTLQRAGARRSQRTGVS